MKQLTVISGKGGTGKTTLTAAFASLAENAVFVDCDVDAADLHLILKPEIIQTQVFTGLKVAVLDNSKCIECGKCIEHCRFDAIDEFFNIRPGSCEGCGVCEFICQENAIQLEDRPSGFAYISETRFGPMAHARLMTAEEASGKLVTMVRNNARILAHEKNKELIIIDGPPGIGCPVIAAISGVNLVLIVTEPTLSGISDMERILNVTQHFKIPAMVCVNKYDINIENTKKIEHYCHEQGIQTVGRIPYDNITTMAMIEEKSVIEYSDCDFTKNIIEIWNKVKGGII